MILTAKSSQVYFEKVDASWVTTITLFSLFLELRIVYPSFNWNERYCFNTMILFNVEFSFCNGQHLFDINKKMQKLCLSWRFIMWESIRKTLKQVFGNEKLRDHLLKGSPDSYGFRSLNHYYCSLCITHSGSIFFFFWKAKKRNKD